MDQIRALLWYRLMSWLLLLLLAATEGTKDFRLTRWHQGSGQDPIMEYVGVWRLKRKKSYPALKSPVTKSARPPPNSTTDLWSQLKKKKKQECSNWALPDGNLVTNQSHCWGNCPSLMCFPVVWACVCVLYHQAGKIQGLTEEERAHLLPLLHNAQWVEVVGRDAIYKEFTFKDFNQVFVFFTHVLLLNQNSHFKYNVIKILTEDLFFSIGFWFYVQSSSASREDGPPPRVVQCL